MSHGSAHVAVRSSHSPAAILAAISGLADRLSERAAARRASFSALPRWEMPVTWARPSECAACGEPVEPTRSRCIYCGTRAG